MGIACCWTQTSYSIFLMEMIHFYLFFENRNLILSVITELELLGWSGFTDEELKSTKEFLNRCSIINLNSDIKDRSIAVRRKYKMKLPDSIIAGTALSMGIPLITADLDFKVIKSANIISI